MCKGYKVIESDFLEIPFDDMKGVEFVVCFDPQNRLGESTWAVVEVSEFGDYKNSKGLFWKRDDAEIFAEALLN